MHLQSVGIRLSRECVACGVIDSALLGEKRGLLCDLGNMLSRQRDCGSLCGFSSFAFARLAFLGVVQAGNCSPSGASVLKVWLFVMLLCGFSSFAFARLAFLGVVQAGNCSTSGASVLKVWLFVMLRCRARRYSLSVHDVVVCSPSGTNSLDVATVGLFKYSMCLAGALHVESEGLRVLERCVSSSHFQSIQVTIRRSVNVA